MRAVSLPNHAGLKAAVEQRDRDISTKRFYETSATGYAEATLRLSMKESIDSFVTRLNPGDSVVDLGCGAGRDLKAFADRGFMPVGLDVSENLAKIAHEYSAQPVVVGDLRKLPFASNSFSAGWASASLLHLSRDDAGLALGEIRRVLTAGGILFSSVKHGQGERADAQGRWFSYYGSVEWQCLLEAHGFAVIELHTSVQQVGTVSVHESARWLNTISRNTR